MSVTALGTAVVEEETVVSYILNEERMGWSNEKSQLCYIKQWGLGPFPPPISVQPTAKDEWQAWKELCIIWGSLLNSYHPHLTSRRVLPVLNSILRTVAKRHCLASKSVVVHDFLKQWTTQQLAILQGGKMVCLLTVENFTWFKKKRNKINSSKLKLVCWGTSD